MQKTIFYFFLLAVSATKGDSHFSPRMIGGINAKNGTLPFIASIKHIHGTSWIKSCLGTIIHKNWILSSALCLQNLDPKNIVVDLNVYTHSQAPKIRFEQNTIYIHPKFNNSNGKNDIGLIRLSKPIEFTDLVKPIRLGYFKDKVGTKIVATGWNEDPEEGLGKGIPNPYHLGFLKVKFATTNTCIQKFPDLYSQLKFDSTQICGIGGKGKDLCNVDFGAPLLDQNRNQIGVFSDVIFLVSGHSHQCHPGHIHPLFFTRVSAYADWINKVTNLELI